MNDNVVNMNLNPISAKALIKQIIENTERVFFTNHAESRMTERGITRAQIFKCLEHGRVTEEPFKDVHGNWKLNLSSVSAGQSVTAVCVLDCDEDGNYCLIVTAF